MSRHASIKSIVVFGSGAVSSHIVEQLVLQKYHVTVVTRDVEKVKQTNLGILSHRSGIMLDFLRWTPEAVPPTRNASLSNNVQVPEKVPELDQPVIEAMNGCFAVINLAGKSPFNIYDSRKKVQKAQMNRIMIIRHIAYLISKCKELPTVVLNASTITYYGIAHDPKKLNEEITEDCGHGDDFWGHGTEIIESEARNISHKLNVPVINLRFGIIVCAESKILQEQLPLLRGSIGTGNQWLSWIHIEDVGNSIVLLLQAIASDMNDIFTLVGGTINMCTPSPIKQKDFARILNEELHSSKHATRTPMWMLKLLLGKPADVIAKSLKVMPVKLSQLGYKYKYLSLQAAVRNQFGQSVPTGATKDVV